MNASGGIQSIAVASHAVWHGTFSRYNNRGCEGIGLIDDSGDYLRVKYVYAFEDTNGGKLPYIWRYKPEHETAVADAFDYEAYPKHTDAFLVFACVEKSQEAVGSYLDSVIENSRDSVLARYDRDMVKKCFLSALIGSSAYTVFNRVGITSIPLNEDELFASVLDFNTPALTTILGTATAAASSDILRTVEQAVKRYDRQKIYGKGSVSNERSHRQTAERPEQPAVQSRSEGQQSPGQIRTASEGLSEKDQTGVLQRDAAVRHADDTPASDGRGSVGDGGTADSAATPKDLLPAGRDRLGKNAAQTVASAQRRRNGAGRVDPQQLRLFDMGTAAEQSAAFPVSELEMTERDYIDDVLLSGSQFQGGKKRIYDFYTQNGVPPSAKDGGGHRQSAGELLSVKISTRIFLKNN